MADILIVTPFHDCFDAFQKTFVSVINQTYPDFDWVIVDDASRNIEHEKLLSLAATDSRVKVVRNKKRIGAGGARNLGLRCFDHKYLTFIDADDLWEVEFLEVMLALQLSSNARVVFSGYKRWNEQTHKYISPYTFVGFINADDILNGNPISCLATLIRPDPQLSLPLFGEIRKRNDLVFFYRVLKLYGPAYGSDNLLATYNMRTNSLSRNKFNLLTWQWRVYRKFAEKNILQSVLHLLRWSLYGFLKYRK